MGRLDVVIPDELEQDFREEIFKQKGMARYNVMPRFILEFYYLTMILILGIDIENEKTFIFFVCVDVDGMWREDIL